MAKHYGAEVLGIDLSDNMLAIANEHKREMSKEVQNLVTFRFLDATLAHFPAESFDVVYSRDAIMHIADKEPLYEKVLVISEFELKTSKSDIAFWYCSFLLTRFWISRNFCLLRVACQKFGKFKIVNAKMYNNRILIY